MPGVSYVAANPGCLSVKTSEDANCNSSGHVCARHWLGGRRHLGAGLEAGVPEVCVIGDCAPRRGSSSMRSGKATTSPAEYSRRLLQADLLADLPHSQYGVFDEIAQFRRRASRRLAR